MSGITNRSVINELLAEGENTFGTLELPIIRSGRRHGQTYEILTSITNSTDDSIFSYDSIDIQENVLTYTNAYIYAPAKVLDALLTVMGE
jgi:hypothetical protein